MGYKYHKIPKSEIISKMPETDEIFKNVDESILNDIGYEIKNIIKDGTTSKHFKPGTNKQLSKIGQKIALRRFYRICIKYIK